MHDNLVIWHWPNLRSKNRITNRKLIKRILVHLLDYKFLKGVDVSQLLTFLIIAFFEFFFSSK